MPKIIKVKRTNVAGATPTLSYGELGWNSADAKLYAGDAANLAVLVNTPSTGGSGGGSAGIVEAETSASFPASGAPGTLYIATSVSRVFRWDVSGVYVEIGTSGGGGSGSSVLTAATASQLGGIKVGSGLTISDGVLSAAGDATLRSLFVPGVPTSVSATGGNAQATVSWTAPTGVITQAPITGYVVEWTPAGGSPSTVSTGSTSTSYTKTGLANGTAVTFRVAAVNGVGSGAYSTASGAVTPAAAAAVTYANKYGAGSYTLTGTSTITATVTGGGDTADTRLWLLIGTTGTLSYAVTASSEDGFDGGRLYLTSSAPATNTNDGVGWNQASISGLTNVSAAVSGVSASTGTASVTAGQYLVLRYAKSSDDTANQDKITAVLSIS